MSGRKLFFKLFKGFEPEIELQYDDSITDKDTFDLKILFSGKWNGVSEARRNALAEYSKNYLGQDTYDKLPPVTGNVTVTIRDSATGQPYSPLTASVNGEATISKRGLDEGIYDIEVSYTANSAEVPNYADTEVIFENALTVTKKPTRAYATAKASNKRISEPATLDGNSSGIDVVVPVTIEDSAHGSVKVDEKYGAPGTEAKLTVTPESGYVLDKLIVTYNNGIKDAEIEFTDKKVIESVNEEGGIDTEVVTEEGVYYFTRPDGSVVVRASFKRSGTGTDIVIDESEWFEKIKQSVLACATGSGSIQPGGSATYTKQIEISWKDLQNDMYNN